MDATLVVNEIYLSLQGESTFAGLPCVFVRLAACNLRCSYCDTAYAFTGGRRRPLTDILADVEQRAAPYRRDSRPEPLPLPVPQPPEQPLHEPSLSDRGWSPPAAIQAHPPPQRPKLRLETSRGPSQSPVAHRLPLVELTGGEPLLQPGALPLMTSLCDRGFTVLLETSGALDISPVDPRVRRIMDLKGPSSGESDRNHWANLAHLRPTDEIKFVLGTREDYAWAKQVISEHRLAARCPLLFSWVHPLAPDQQDPSLKRVPAGMTPLTRRDLAEAVIADALPVRFQAQLHKLIWPPEQRGV